ncbi:MAG: hypothetical protein QXY87_08320 [Saccharolobus sp.]|uniref:hypothetical protein n=1 Tax=Saccharolobus TaxID=2100760 RepID=UPI001F0E69B0|nr:hypothetical protein [Saccharolobus shibatae]MCH4815660.1 hypothetical protein [Saccharolobus shibatae]
MKKVPYEKEDITVTKTIRIPRRIVNKVEKLLYDRNEKFNQLINKLLDNYANYISKIEYISNDKPVIISSRFFKLLTESLGQNIGTISEQAYKFGKEWGREYLLIWNDFKILPSGFNNIDIFLSFLQKISKYSGLFKLDLQKEKDHVICIFHHDYNQVYSVILGFYYKGILESCCGEYEIIDMVTNHNNLILKIKIREKV